MRDVNRLLVVLGVIAGLLLVGCASPTVSSAPADPTSQSHSLPLTATRLAAPAEPAASLTRPAASASPVQPTSSSTRTVKQTPAAPLARKGTPTPRPPAVETGRSGTPTSEGTPTPVATRIVGPPSVPVSPRYEPLPLRVDAALEAQIRDFLGDEVTHYGIVVKRLADGVGVAINADQEFYAASLFKLLVMYEVFKQRELGLLSFEERLTVTPPYLEYELGYLRWPLWSEVTIQELVEAMITESDNIAAMLLHDKVAGWNIIRDFKAVGLEHTDIEGETMPTSASDMALWLEMIATGQAVSEPSSQAMIDLLSRQTINDRLPALLPEGTKVAHKTGNWDNATHDVGVVYAPSGAYVIAILSDTYWEADPIAELSRLVYDYFEEQSTQVQSDAPVWQTLDWED